MRLTAINDGYNETATVDGYEYEFRPIIGRNRDRMFAEMQANLGDTEWIAYEWLVRHVYFGLVGDASLTRLLKAVAHLNRREEDHSDLQNLVDGVWLELRHPEVSRRDCEHCREWWYKEDGTIAEKAGKPLRRLPGAVVPCETKAGCPKGSPQDSLSLSQKNLAAYEHFLDCRAVYRFPEDPIVTEHARLITEVIQRHER